MSFPLGGQHELFEKPKMTMEQLVDYLNKASYDYYNGKERMSNKLFDEYIDDLKKMEAEEGRVLPNSPTRKVGAPVTGDLPKFKHTYPALSLDKTKDIEELVSKFNKGIVDSKASLGNDYLVVMYKEDGSTVQAYYNGGKLDHLVTRGNGEVGSDITHNASAINGIPLTIPFKGELVVRGEALISYDDFNAINEKLPDDQKFKNPRNLAAASIQMLDPEETQKRKVNVKIFNLVHISGLRCDEIKDHAIDYKFSDRLNALDKLGFDTVDRIVCEPGALKSAVNTLTNDVSNYSYPVDGLVVAMDNYQYTKDLEGTEHHPNIMQGYAFKWADETRETILREIEWSPSRTGLLNPVAIFDPVEIDGTTVKRASVHNLSIMREMNLKIGDRIKVFKSNMIIPQISENMDSEKDRGIYIDEDFLIDLIGKCPTCGAPAKIHKSSDGIETVYCPNEECPEKMIGKLAHFCERDCMDIQGMSEETIQKLVDAGFIKEYKDFFELDQKPGIAFLPGFGKQSWKKMCDAAEKARTTDFVKFITAIGITNIGKGQAKTLYKYISENYDELCEVAGFLSDIYEPVMLLAYLVDVSFDFSKIDGFGKIMADELSKWILEHFSLKQHTTEESSPEVRVFVRLNFTDKRPSGEKVQSSISGKSFCITGKLIHHSNRQELVDKIESLGGKWVDSVSSKTDYLINNDLTSTSGKNKKAHDLNIPIISEEDFMEMIK